MAFGYIYFIDYCWLLIEKICCQTKKVSNLLKFTLRGRKGTPTWNRRKKVGKCRIQIKGAKDATNNAYLTAFLSSNTYIDLSVRKLLLFCKGAAP